MTSPSKSILRRIRSVGFVVLGSWLTYIFGFLYLANIPVDDEMARGVLARFWMQADILSAVVFGVGFAGLFQACDTFLKKYINPDVGGDGGEPAASGGGVAGTFSSPTNKLSVVFLVMVISAATVRMPFVDHAYTFHHL